jgi:small-conductance mechanosensitive channel
MREFALQYFNKVNSPVLKALIVLVLYVLFAKLTDILINRVLRRLTRFTRSDLDDRIIDMTHRPVFLTVIAIGCIHSIIILNTNLNFVFYTKGIVFSLLVCIWGIFIIRISSLIIGNSLHKVADVTGLSREVAPLVENILKVAIFAAGLMIVLSIWKLDITPLMASAGIAGVAIALAAKDTLANFFGGISIFMDKPYKIGDFIVLDGGERGEVVNIGIRSTRIKTRDDILISIPNSILANSKIINESAPVPKFRIRIPVSTAYGSEVNQIEDILLSIADENENILKDPEPRVRFREFGESSLNFELLCWAKEPVLRGKTIHEINKSIYNKFNESGVVIPFPQRTVYLREDRDWKP